MSLRTKANITGDIAIISGIIAFGIVLFSLFYEIKFSTVIVFVLTILCSEMKNEYLELRKREIDKQIQKQYENIAKTMD